MWSLVTKNGQKSFSFFLEKFSRSHFLAKKVELSLQYFHHFASLTEKKNILRSFLSKNEIKEVFCEITFWPLEINCKSHMQFGYCRPLYENESQVLSLPYCLETGKTEDIFFLVEEASSFSG